MWSRAILPHGFLSDPCRTPQLAWKQNPTNHGNSRLSVSVTASIIPLSLASTHHAGMEHAVIAHLPPRFVGQRVAIDAKQFKCVKHLSG